ncbi:lactonase family protein [Lactonifactor longoviformis]|uniref:6-phosphogluconolactonase n=1 Tax=Lactonifactor longoviformis DSM 17459 TaxID=1122155 RepID=A0A1M4W0J2_9CLOT|nr:lactonase family protein [Lactonifactor longoviformis]POP34741.1 lactonase family protein [Lactonifactor longoviformis]SHE74768.1 6-phosphogluconolactonase [Lactonifactor longoviformis DSM 17459]
MDRKVWIGTCTGKTDGGGIYVCGLDEDTGKLQIRGVQRECSNPGFLARNKEKGLLCAVNEGEDRNWVSVYRDSMSGIPRLTDEKEIPGEGPCHISMGRDGTRIYYANYESGDIGMLYLNGEGRFLPDTYRIVHRGRSVGERQNKAHPHEVHLLGKQEMLLVPDLGTDEIVLYDLRWGRPQKMGEVKVCPGDGPRHLAAHPGGCRLYLVCEMENMVYAFQWTEEKKLQQMQRISLLGDGKTGEYIAGEIAVTSDGRWLVTSTRAWGSRKEEEGYLSLFPITAGGILEPPRLFPSGGCHPRMFSITENDKYILTANQYSGNLVSFRLDKRLGAVEVCDTVPIPGAACVLCGEKE